MSQFGTQPSDTTFVRASLTHSLKLVLEDNHQIHKRHILFLFCCSTASNTCQLPSQHPMPARSQDISTAFFLISKLAGMLWPVTQKTEICKILNPFSQIHMPSKAIRQLTQCNLQLQAVPRVRSVDVNGILGLDLLCIQHKNPPCTAHRCSCQEVSSFLACLDAYN